MQGFWTEIKLGIGLYITKQVYTDVYFESIYLYNKFLYIYLSKSQATTAIISWLNIFLIEKKKKKIVNNLETINGFKEHWITLVSFNYIQWQDTRLSTIITFLLFS